MALEQKNTSNVSDYSNIVLHVIFVIASLIILGVSIFKPEDPMYYIVLGIAINLIMVIAIIVDAIIYNIFVKKNIHLIVFAFFFNALYLLNKGKIIYGETSTASIIVFFGYVVSILICYVNLFIG